MNLKDYIKGQRQGKEANQLERKAMDDPFLQDAIDGYDSVEGDHISVIEELEKRLSTPRKRINKQMWIWAAAAVIILLTGIPLLLHNSYTEDDTTVASSSDNIIRQKEERETATLKEDTVLLADHQKLDKIEPPRQKREMVTDNIDIAQIPSSAIPPVTERISIEEPQKEIADRLSGRAAGVVTSQQMPGKDVHVRGRTVSNTSLTDRIVVSGRIVDETGEPLAGATIHLPDTPTATISDTAGNFLLIVPKEEEGALIASFVGMKNAKIPLKEEVGDIMLKADDMALNEVVVIGYGTQRKKMVTGSVATIEQKSLFGEEEFREYFIENYDKNICAGQNIAIFVEFLIDPIGRPSQINIKENSCPILESEIKRLLLGSPRWSRPNRKVSLQIEIP